MNTGGEPESTVGTEPIRGEPATALAYQPSQVLASKRLAKAASKRCDGPLGQSSTLLTHQMMAAIDHNSGVKLDQLEAPTEQMMKPVRKETSKNLPTFKSILPYANSSHAHTPMMCAQMPMMSASDVAKNQM